MLPLQSSSMPLQDVSLAAGVPGVHPLCTTPATQDEVPPAAQAPTPHDVDVGEYASSALPSQSSSALLHDVSAPAGEPGVQSSVSSPSTQDVLPVLAHAPTPHATSPVTKSSSMLSSQSSS